MLENAQNVGQPIIGAKVLPEILSFSGTVPAGQTKKFELTRKMSRRGRFKISRRRCVLRLGQAIGSTPVGFPLARVTDPSPVAGVGNAIPHVDMVRFAFHDDNVALDPELLPTTIQFGTEESGVIREDDLVLDFSRSDEFAVEVLNESSVPVEFFIGLDGLFYAE
jgi:hypothetical protein